MIFENWYEKIKSYRDKFIEYYVSQFSEENRKLVTKRFDSLKFCFYIDPNYIETWVSLQMGEEYFTATYNFLKEFGDVLGIDISKVSLKFSEEYGYISMFTEDESIEAKLRNLFGGLKAFSPMPDSSDFYDLFCFRNLEDFIKGKGQSFDNPEQKLLRRRLLFLKDMGEITIEGNPYEFFKTEECRNFVNSSRYKELETKYSNLAARALEYKREVSSKYKDLLDYMKKSIQVEEQIKMKYDTLKSDEIDPSKIEEYERACKKEIASLRIIGGNFDISNCLNEESALESILNGESTQNTSFICSGSEKQETVIFFCPFKSVPGYEDVDLRHEIRHGITSSGSVDGNITKNKVGNLIEKFVGNKSVECELLNWNEWVTQIEAKRETRAAFSEDIYIISKPGIRNRNVTGNFCGYDKYLPLFEIIYSAIPASAMQSQIELSNDSLYRFISLEQLTEIERMIINGIKNAEEVASSLYKIAAQLTNDYNISGGVKK